MSHSSIVEKAADATARATPVSVARCVRGLSDRAIAWLFIAPAITLLLAINIFPLLWAVYLSFTNYRANRPNVPMRWMGIDWYQSILTDPDIWSAMQVTAHFVFWTVVIETNQRNTAQNAVVEVPMSQSALKSEGVCQFYCFLSTITSVERPGDGLVLRF